MQLSAASQDELQDLASALRGDLADGEIMGCDSAGRIVAWETCRSMPVMTGESLDTADIASLPFIERDRIERDGYRYGLIPYQAPGL